MQRCIVIGLDENDKLQFGGSTSNAADILLMLESAKHLIIQQTMGD